MAVDSRFSEISEFLAELLADTNPSLPGSYPIPDLGGNRGSAVEVPILGDESAQNVNFSAEEMGGGDDLGRIPPISGDVDAELLLPASSDRLGSVSSDPLVSLNSRLSPGGEPSSLDDTSDSDLILKYINQLLMEENKEDNPWFSGDETALRNTEKSLYDALGENYPPQLPCQNSEVSVGHLDEEPSGTLPVKGCELGSCGYADTSIGSSDSGDPSFVRSPGEFLDHALLNASYFGNEAVQLSTESVAIAPGKMKNGGEDAGHTDAPVVLVENKFKDCDSVLQFKKGLEEASKFLPSSPQLLRNLDDNRSVPMTQKNLAYGADGGGSKGLKNHARDDAWVEEGRASKQTAVAGDEGEISEMFDKVLLYDGQAYTGERSPDILKNSWSSAKRRTSRGDKGFVKKQTSKTAVDLRSLLFLCAEAVNGHDLRTANELLKQIRENSSPSGDGSERLAHYFANGLEARIAGTEGDSGSFFTWSPFLKASATDMLKAYHAYITACPFMKFPIIFSCYMVSLLAANAKVLHIIDFGLGHGFQWPIVIQRISQHPMGPPKLRMTGIEYPVRGFRPAQRIEEAGRRLAQYCDRFGVPFEFNVVASREWETIKIEDLKIQRGETIAVNCHNRLKSIMDDMGEEDSPRDAMLDLIRRINPDLYVNSTPSATYNSPFFMARFREALVHFAGLYDMLDLFMSADSCERQTIEAKFYGREITNVIACEGRERTERPETYKQWHARHLRAGFKPLPLDRDIMNDLRSNIRKWYHKDFIMDEYNNNWMLLGWRGRITNVSSCWVPC